MASPLTLILPIIPGTDLQDIGAALAKTAGERDEALRSIGTVHYARILLFDSSSPNLQPTGQPSDNLSFAVITEFDGSFNDYIHDFVAKIGGIFDTLLQFVVGGQELIPVADNEAAFAAFIAKNDASQHQPNGGLYQAYTATVQEILANLPPADPAAEPAVPGA